MYHTTLSPNGIDPDATPLISLLKKIHTQYFSQNPLSNIRWGIPPSIQVRRIIRRIEPKLSDAEKTRLAHGKSLLAAARWNEALLCLKPLADAGHAEAECLLSHLLRRLNGNWEIYAKRYADRLHTQQLVPASNYDSHQNRITLHTYLAHRKAPQFVLAYLIFHEVAGSLFPCNEDGTPALLFLDYETQAPQRAKALHWLSRHGFPIFHID